MAISDWSTTPGSNGSSDASINFAEGQAPSTVNDSARSLMARVRHWFNWFGATTTSGGASNAYTLTSGESLSAYVAGMRFAWSPNADSTGAVTINVDTIGAKKVYMPDGSQANTGDLDADSIYDLIYDTALDSSAGGFKIVGFPDAVTSGALLAANNLSDLANATTARTNLGVAIGSNVQAYDAGLADIAGLAVTDGNFIVANGLNWIAESGATARTSLGLGSLATLSSVNNSNWSGTDLAVANGGTGASDAATARTNLGAYGSGDNVSFGTLAATNTDVTGYLKVSDDGADDFAKLINSGTTSALELGNTEGAGGTFRLEYARVTGVTQLYTGNAHATSVMAFDASGNVGIGTSSPGAKFEVNGESRFTRSGVNTQYIRTLGDASVSGFELVSASKSFAIRNDASGGDLTLSTLAAQPIRFATANTERMRIDSSGNVGIGTTSPATTLDVRGSGLIQQMVSSNTSAYAQYVDSTSAVLAVGIIGGAGYIGTTSSDVLRLYTVNSERLRIDTSGNVGIGTTSPSGTVHISETGKAGTGSPALYIGAMSAATESDISLHGNAVIGTEGSLTFGFESGGFFRWGSITASETGAAGVSEMMRIDSSGNVGIGTSSPGAKLDVNGEMRAYAENNASVNGTLVDATHLKGAINGLNGNVTVPTATAGANGVLCGDGSARTITRGTGLTMYVNGSNSASATLAARGVASILFTSSTVCYVSGDVS